MGIKHICALGVAAVWMSGCASAANSFYRNDFTLLQMALRSSPQSLQVQADQGDGRSQLALSLVYEFGLHGVQRDNQRAVELKTQALKRRGNTAITQYIPGINGKPGRTAIINMPKYDVSAVDVRKNEICAQELAAGRGAETQACGDPENAALLGTLWRRMN